jgi:hypothetical protein
MKIYAKVLELNANSGLKPDGGLRKGIKNIFTVAAANLHKHPPPLQKSFLETFKCNGCVMERRYQSYEFKVITS